MWHFQVTSACQGPCRMHSPPLQRCKQYLLESVRVRYCYIFFRMQITILDSTHLHCRGMPHAGFKGCVSWSNNFNHTDKFLSSPLWHLMSDGLRFHYVPVRSGHFIRCLVKFMASSHELTRVTMTEGAVYVEREREIATRTLTCETRTTPPTYIAQWCEGAQQRNDNKQLSNKTMASEERT